MRIRVLGCALTLILLSGCSHVSYLWQAGVGQFSLYNHERDLNEVIADPRTPEDVRERLQWIPEIKKLVEKELLIKATGNYNTYVDLKRPYVVWSITAAEPYELKLYEWSFPIVGAFPYLGFFKEETAREWMKEYEAKGYDTYIRGVKAYSTLGYLRDPLLSSMLSKRKADMVNLVFHETAHSVIYIKGQGSFNEQAASYIGDYGERLWLERNFGKNSEEYRAWYAEREDRRLMGKVLREYADRLKALYKNFASEDDGSKKFKKRALFGELNKALSEAKWQSEGYRKGMQQTTRWLTNNASLLAVLTYEDDQDIFDGLDQKCKGQLNAALRFLESFIERYRDTHSSPQSMLREDLKNSELKCN